MSHPNNRTGWTLSLLGLALLLGFGLYLIATDAPLWRFLQRLYRDRAFLKATVESWGYLGPLVFIVIQALQVVISPIPGEATGLAGGFLFGRELGFVYSTVGLTAGTLACFGIGRWLGAAFVRRFVSARYWEKMGFIVEAEGAILCFVLYLVPGFPKDIISYLFGLSPMPLWVFALVSTLGRIPGTWVLSAQGGSMAAGQLREFALLLAVAAAVALPLYYYRGRVLGAVRGGEGRRAPSEKGLDKARGRTVK